jgi:hypothetical protein
MRSLGERLKGSVRKFGTGLGLLGGWSVVQHLQFLGKGVRRRRGRRRRGQDV